MSGITMKQVLDGVEPILRIRDRPIPLQTVLKNGREHILRMSPKSGILLHSKFSRYTNDDLLMLG